MDESEQRREDENFISVIIADHQGTIHAYSKHTPAMYHVEESALRGKNFFQLMSAYSRRFCFETFGSNMFKTFKQMSRTLRFSLPHMDDVNYENFHVVTCKVTLVKPKITSPLYADHYMVRILTRKSSEESTRRLFMSYSKAREELRQLNFNPYNLQREADMYAPIVPANQYTFVEKKSAFNSCANRPPY